MKILINASNLGKGGAIQVADSICCSLSRFSSDTFVVVLTPNMKSVAEKIKSYCNVILLEYELRNNVRSYLFARDKFLDNLVESHHVDVVFSIFGPTWWTPKRPHLCGFALAHLVMPESPYFLRMSVFERYRNKLNNILMTFFYRRCSRVYYTENTLISERVQTLLHCDNVYTVTNTYNQVFDFPALQKNKILPKFNGITILTISNAYPHKNLPISIDISICLTRRYPTFKFRFVFSIEGNQFPHIPDEIRGCFLFIGPVDISECPSLYAQSDVSFQPSLLECSTATYPESMRMGLPIVTPDLEFARSLCADAAAYYEPLSGDSAAEAIHKVATDDEYRHLLINNGRTVLSHYDTYDSRCSKLIAICKSIEK